MHKCRTTLKWRFRIPLPILYLRRNGVSTHFFNSYTPVLWRSHTPIDTCKQAGPTDDWENLRESLVGVVLVFSRAEVGLFCHSFGFVYKWIDEVCSERNSWAPINKNFCALVIELCYVINAGGYVKKSLFDLQTKVMHPVAIKKVLSPLSSFSSNSLVAVKNGTQNTP